MRYPIHRSLILWGGLLVMGFIGWAWRDSRGDDSYVVWQRFSAGSSQNGILVFRNARGGSSELEVHRERAANVFPELVPPPFFLRGKGREMDDEKTGRKEAQTFEALGTAYMMRRSPETWCLFTPYWLVLLGVAGVTGGLLGWRVRRWRKWQRLQEAGTTMEGVA